MGSENSTVILSSAYLAPIQYFTKLISFKNIIIEGCENFQKQSYRNRTIILTANGVLTLSIPVKEGANVKLPMKEVQISYDHPWQKVHWGGIVSAYRNSPFFDYYADDFTPFFHQKKWKFLLDFNLEIQDAVLQVINIKVDSTVSSHFHTMNTPIIKSNDFRNAIHPKTHRSAEDKNFFPLPYVQVFHEKYGFVPNLSIIDLLFNEGPSAEDYIKRSSV